MTAVHHSSDIERDFARHLSDGKPALLTFDFCQDYLSSRETVRLFAALAAEGGRHYAVIGQEADAAASFCSGLTLDRELLVRLADELQSPLLQLNGPLALEPVAIPKPWGREIWYTGIEARGQSRVTDGHYSLPLPWVLALSPGRLLADNGARPNLLKILDPLPEPVFGDLYFELHEEKREVYVVTHVDPGAWPGGEGAIRFGFDQQVRRRYGDDGAFRAAFQSAVEDYENVRRRIDRLLDECRRQEGVGLDEPVPPVDLKRWLATVPAPMQEEEAAAREAMEAFTHMRPLAVGDVVKVPTLLPHALQHGVRAVEFQTPVYERKILSFAQKVLTQSHWDTADAVALMSFDAPAPEELDVVSEGSDHRLEQVVAFDDFAVHRLRLEPGCRWLLPDMDSYRVLMVVSGTLVIGGDRVMGGNRYGPEQACLLPRGASATLEAEASPALVLISNPR